MAILYSAGDSLSLSLMHTYNLLSVLIQQLHQYLRQANRRHKYNQIMITKNGLSIRALIGRLQSE